jgi:Zn-dependent M28 family amino/carboxypeptidase
VKKPQILIYWGGIGLLVLLVGYWYFFAFSRGPSSAPFDGARAFKDVQMQVEMGPRIPDSASHAKAVQWIRTELESAGWHVEIQSATAMGHPIQNLLAYRSDGPPQVLLGAHYDTRIFASRDPDPSKQTQPVPGADDGASGVAVLLELARSLPRDTAPIWLAFFDAEDNGEIPGWQWLLGSEAFVAQMIARPKAMVLVDMVGDADLSLPMEANSDPALRTSIWQTASKLGHGDVFIPQVKYRIEDDHLPFIRAGIPSVDIIDLDYAYWHTTADTPEHVTAKSLQIVGDVLRAWIVEQASTAK